jgi:hypothetical protein
MHEMSIATAVVDARWDSVVLASPFGCCECGGVLRIIAGDELRVKDMEIA